MDISIYSIENIPKLVNIAGRQRMLCQRIAFLLVIQENETFNETLNLFISSNDILTHGNEELPKPKKDSSVFDYFHGSKNAHTKIENFIRSAKAFSTSTKQEQKEFLNLAAYEMVPLLNDLVLIYQDISYTLTQKRTVTNELIVKCFKKVQKVAFNAQMLSINAQITASLEKSNSFSVIGKEMKTLSESIHLSIDEVLSQINEV